MAVYERRFGEEQVHRHHTEDGSEDDARMREFVEAGVDGWAVFNPPAEKRTRAKKDNQPEG